MEDNKKPNLIGFKIFIIVFLLISILLLKGENQDKLLKFLNAMGNKEISLELVDSFNNSGIEDMKVYDNTMVRWKKNKLSFIKLDGIPILEKEFNFAEPLIHYGDKYIYVTDKTTGDIYCFNNKGETIDTLKIGNPIFNLKESNGNLIYHMKNTAGESIKILDRDRVLIGTYSYEDKNILTYAANKDGTRSVVSLLNLKDGNLKSEIEFYGENKEILGSVDMEDEIVLYLDCISKEETLALSDRSLYLIKDSKIQWRKSFDLIKDVCLQGDKIYVLYSSYLQSINFNGKVEETIGFPHEYHRVLSFEGKLLLYGENHIALLQDNEELLSHEEGIVKAFINKDSIILWTPEKINIYKMNHKKSTE